MMIASNVLKRLAMLPLAAILSACVTMTDSAGTDIVDTSCDAFQPIRWSTADTDDTIRQVKGHNAAWLALCEAQPH